MLSHFSRRRIPTIGTLTDCITAGTYRVLSMLLFRFCRDRGEVGRSSRGVSRENAARVPWDPGTLADPPLTIALVRGLVEGGGGRHYYKRKRGGGRVFFPTSWGFYIDNSSLWVLINQKTKYFFFFSSQWYRRFYPHSSFSCSTTIFPTKKVP